MTPSILFAFWSLINFGFAVDTSDFRYTPQQRVAYIAKALVSLRQSKPKAIQRVREFVEFAMRYKCQSNYGELKVRCLIEEVKKNCQQFSNMALKKQCLYFADIVVVNRLNEDHFIGPKTRYEILKSKKNFREEMLRILNLRYAGMVAEFAMTRHFNCPRSTASCLASGIDKYCLSSADKRNLSWPACISALVWFIGTHKDRG